MCTKCDKMSHGNSIPMSHFHFYYIHYTRGDFMGLTSSSTGSKLLSDDIEVLKDKCDYTIAIARESQCRKKYCF